MYKITITNHSDYVTDQIDHHYVSDDFKSEIKRLLNYMDQEKLDKFLDDDMDYAQSCHLWDLNLHGRSSFQDDNHIVSIEFHKIHDIQVQFDKILQDNQWNLYENEPLRKAMEKFVEVYNQ
jgi:hypothetical protein